VITGDFVQRKTVSVCLGPSTSHRDGTGWGVSRMGSQGTASGER
jgi:hypothetical protein